MALDTQPAIAPYDAPIKDLYEIGEMPPLGHVPKNMSAWAIRRERHGEPEKAMQVEVVPTPELDSHDVLVLVMAAGVNYNGVWTSLGKPLSPLDIHKQPTHIAGSDAAGSCGRSARASDRARSATRSSSTAIRAAGECHHCNGGNPMLCRSQQIWGYETTDGSFAQFCRVEAQQILPKPKHLTWGEAGCYMLVHATGWRMLYRHPPHMLKPAMNVLVWGSSGGLGTMAIQICKAAGGNAIAVVSSADKGDYCLSLGAKAYLNRKDFDCWGAMPDPDDTTNSLGV